MLKSYHGYEVRVYHEVYLKERDEYTHEIFTHYFLEEDAAKKFFNNTELKDDILQLNFYECTLNMEGSQVINTDDEELIDQKY